MATKEEKGTKAEDEKAEADLPIEELQAMGFATTGPKEGKSQRQTIDPFVMNLPGSALEFLDAYNGCCKPLEEQPDFLGRDKIKMPLVHTHCFTKKVEEAEADICEVSFTGDRHILRSQLMPATSSALVDILTTPSNHRWTATIYTGSEQSLPTRTCTV